MLSSYGIWKPLFGTRSRLATVLLAVIAASALCPAYAHGAGLSAGGLSVATTTPALRIVDRYGHDMRLSGGQIPEYLYEGEPAKPVAAVLDATGELVEGRDYTVTYMNNASAPDRTGDGGKPASARAVAIVRGLGERAGGASAVVVFALRKASLADPAEVAATTIPAQKAGAHPEPKLRLPGGTLLMRGTDYDLEWRDGEPGGTASVIARALPGRQSRCAGSVEIRFDVEPDEIPISQASAQIGKATYTGRQARPDIHLEHGGRALAEGVDYEVAGYGRNVSAGKGTVAVRGIGAFSGESTLWFEIAPADISQAEIGKIGRMMATGRPLRPEPPVRFGGRKLELGNDYELSYSSNVSAGLAEVTVEGKGNFEGSTRIRFRIDAPYFTVTFKGNGGEGAMATQKIGRGTNSKLYRNKFVRYGYVFDGWNTKRNGKGQNYKNKAAVRNLAKAGKKVTLYAQWKYRGKIAAEAARGERDCFDDRKYRGLVYNGGDPGDPSTCSEFGMWCLYQGGARFGKGLMPRSYAKKVLKSGSGKWSYSWKHVAYYRDNPEQGEVHKPGDGYKPQPGDLLILVNSRHSGVTRHLADANLQGANHTRVVTAYSKGRVKWSGGNGTKRTHYECGGDNYARSHYYCIHPRWDNIDRMRAGIA